MENNPELQLAWQFIKIQAHIYFLPEKQEPGKRHFLDD